MGQIGEDGLTVCGGHGNIWMALVGGGVVPCACFHGDSSDGLDRRHFRLRACAWLVAATCDQRGVTIGLCRP